MSGKSVRSTTRPQSNQRQAAADCINQALSEAASSARPHSSTVFSKLIRSPHPPRQHHGARTNCRVQLDTDSTRAEQEQKRPASVAACCSIHAASNNASLPLISGSIIAAPLERESVARIDPAIGVGTARSGHALGVAGELAVARIAPYAPLQAVAIRHAFISQGRTIKARAICLRPRLPVC